MKIAEFYGWTQPSVAKNSSTCICVQCGAEFSVEGESAHYECERCISDRDE
ncbi:hypothetical protein DNHGIG_07500 [Collibacillus ludicampi]|jgi:hypothetical protein|uniref:YhfH family protein n=1 Tax=Collibacillus ludicampi TaxID=2771369 RepID=A0AAV4LBM7_9BACL|nr:hypothetical protein DNHGIG_07500 [Collibacillus ludicampi]